MEGLIIGRNQLKAEEKTETAKKAETVIKESVQETASVEYAGVEEKKPTQKAKDKKRKK